MVMELTPPSPPSEAADAQTPKDVEARTPWQLAWRRLRRDRATMIMGAVALLAVLIAIFAPLLTAWGVLDPYNFHKDLIDGASGGYRIRRAAPAWRTPSVSNLRPDATCFPE